MFDFSSYISLLYAVILLLCGCFFPDLTTASIQSGIRLCLEQLIPSLFFFLIATELITPISFLKKTSRGVPNGFGQMLWLTVIGGYPTGAICIRNARQNGSLTSRQAKALACVLFCGGPGFLIRLIGNALYKSTVFGILLMLSQLLTMLLGVGIWMYFFRHNDKTVSQPPASIPVSLPQAVNAGCRSMMQMSAAVILFSALSAVVPHLLPNLSEKSGQIIAGLLEITGGCCHLTALTGKSKALWIAFFCGFGGISVHMQLYSILKEDAPNYPFFLGIRSLLSLFGTLIFALLLRFVPQSVTCFSVSSDLLLQSSTDSAAVFFLLILTTLTFCAGFITYLRRD